MGVGAASYFTLQGNPTTYSHEISFQHHAFFMIIRLRCGSIKLQFMKKFFSFLMAALMLLGSGVMMTACEDENSEPSVADYYVQYKAGSMYYLNKVTVATESGKKVYSDYKSSSFNKTFGPVRKGFMAEISVGVSNSSVEIYVSRGNEPFVLKATGSGGAKYKIDF